MWEEKEACQSDVGSLNKTAKKPPIEKKTKKSVSNEPSYYTTTTTTTPPEGHLCCHENKKKYRVYCTVLYLLLGKYGGRNSSSDNGSYAFGL